MRGDPRFPLHHSLIILSFRFWSMRLGPAFLNLHLRSPISAPAVAGNLRFSLIRLSSFSDLRYDPFSLHLHFYHFYIFNQFYVSGSENEIEWLVIQIWYYQQFAICIDSKIRWLDAILQWCDFRWMLMVWCVCVLGFENLSGEDADEVWNEE